MRLRRVSASISVWSSAWPMCRLPVTFGGGSTIEYAGLPLDGSALKYPALTQPSYSCDSAAPGSQDLGRASAEGVAPAVTAPFYGVRCAAQSHARAGYFLPPSRPPRISPRPPPLLPLRTLPRMLPSGLFPPPPPPPAPPRMLPRISPRPPPVGADCAWAS